MSKGSIDYLAYLLDKAKKEGRDKAIVFLGAGVSVSAGIPLTHVIEKHIKIKYRKNPKIKDCILSGDTDYYSLMGVLTADERRDLFHFYVTRDKVKLNIANVYLAQLLKLGYVDYIVTVNFDDLILRAATLFNFLPPVYDLSNIKTVTTTDKRIGSVMYLHGQYFGEWLLNNKDELMRVEEEVLNLFNTIKTRRTWIVVGYSGRDGIFEKMKSLGSFSNELFWVKKKFDDIDDKHILDFISMPNINANKLEGYYADSFFLKLHAELSKLDASLVSPDIFYKPFSYLKSIMQNVKEINETDELDKQLKEMVENCNHRIEKAINDYEKDDSIEEFKQTIIDSIVKEDFTLEKALFFEKQIVDRGYDEAKTQLSWYYGNWGIALSALAKLKGNEELYKESFVKYEKSIELNPKNNKAFNNWGNALSALAKLKRDEELYKESFVKYEKSIELNPKDDSTYYNWGTALIDLAELKGDEELYKESFVKYEKSIELNPKKDSAFINWGNALSDLAKLKRDEELYQESFVKYKKSIELNPKDDSTYYNWGTALMDLAELKGDEELYKESFVKYEKSIELNPKMDSAFNNWGNALSALAKLKGDEELYKESFVKYEKLIELNPKMDSAFNNWGNALSDLAKLKGDDKIWITAEEILLRGVELGGKVYNLACFYALKSEKNSALKYLSQALNKKEVSLKFVEEEDDDWKDYRMDDDFKILISKFKK